MTPLAYAPYLLHSCRMLATTWVKPSSHRGVASMPALRLHAPAAPLWGDLTQMSDLTTWSTKVFKHIVLLIALVAACSCTSVRASNDHHSVRLDATSDTTAQESYEKMMRQASEKQQQALAVAMLKLNMAGVQSAYEVVQDKDLQSVSIARIKDRVAGMTADEIIALAERTSDVKVDVKTK